MFRWFGNKKDNPNGAQIIASSHAASLLSEPTKEEVLLCEKNGNGSTNVWSLANMKYIRRNESFSLKYLRGGYGAIPTIC